MEPTTEIIHLDLEEIRRDGGTQPRAKIDLQHIKRLEEQIEEGQEIEPVVVFFDGDDYWLADGFHRWNAHRNQEEPTIRAIIYHGTRREAVLYSVGANADHKPALPRSRADKRKAVLTLLNDPEWKQWSDRQIARQCKVSDRTVNRLRHSICDNDADTKLNKTRKVKRGNTEYIVDTSKIGKSQITPPETIDNEDKDLTENTKVAHTKIKVTTDEILIAFLSNLEYMSPEQVKAAIKAIASSHPDIIKNLHITD